MTLRFNAMKSASETFKAVIEVEQAIAGSGLEHSLIELVKMRASQINGCAFCLHMHASDARKSGESEMRLYLLNAWREATVYSDRERAALGWTEALTNVAATGAPDDAFEPVRQHFSEAEQAQLTLLIGTINLWNRLQVGAAASHPAL